MGFLSWLGWLVVGGTMVKEGISNAKDNAESRQRAIDLNNLTYIDANGQTRMTCDGTKVYYTTQRKIKDFVLQANSDGRVVFNITRERGEQNKRKAIEKGEAFYFHNRPAWGNGYRVEIETGNIYELQQFGKTKFIMYIHKEYFDKYGNLLLQKYAEQRDLTKEEYVRLGGTPIGCN